MNDLPHEWLQRAEALVGRLALEVAGYRIPVEITREQLEAAYLPALAKLCASGTPAKDAGLRHEEAASAAQAGVASGLASNIPPLTRGGLGGCEGLKGRILAGVAGIPGGGKSTFAAVLQHLADEFISAGTLVVVPMDGWHYPNAVLDSRRITDEGGRGIPLRTRKGGPLSFDVAAMVRSLRELKQAPAAVRLPAYDRGLHEPVPDAVVIPPAARIVLLEGNYIFGNVPGQPEWDEVAGLLSPKVFLECPVEVARERIIARHIRGGCTPEQAREKYQRNDRVNTEIVLGAAERADLRIAL